MSVAAAELVAQALIDSAGAPMATLLTRATAFGCARQADLMAEVLEAEPASYDAPSALRAFAELLRRRAAHD